MLKPKDQHERDRIESDLDATLFVEAGAGTGKTTALVRRLVRLITTPDLKARTPIDAIAAITFTEKAAAELKERLRAALDKKAREDSEAREPAESALAALDGAAIETIHAFAGRLLRIVALESGLPPAFEVRDEIQSQVAFDDWWADVLEDLLLDPDYDQTWRDYLESGLQEKHLRQFAAKLHANCDRIAAPLEAPDNDYDGFVGRLNDLVNYRSGHPDDHLQKGIDELRQATVNLHSLQTPAERLSAVEGLKFARGNSGNKANWNANDLEAARNLNKELAGEAEDLRSAIRTRLATPLLEIIRQRVLAYAHDRMRAGTLEFQDLLRLAAEALRQPEAAERVRKRFRRILVDEFQDTDPLQLAILDAISQGEAGRLFYVGDPRQSIYRFRRADVRLYDGRRSQIPSEDVIHLAENFRSQGHVLDWVNSVFSGMLGEHFAPLGCGKPDHPRLKVSTLGGVHEGPAEEARLREAEEIVQSILALHAEGVRLSEIAILFPSRAILFFLERALLHHGIPFRIESKSLLFETQEARELFSILRAIEDPGDAIAIVGALRTPSFGCNDQDLFDHVQAGRGFNYLAPPPEDGPDRVDDGLQVLRTYHDQRLTLTVAGLAARIVQDRLLFEHALATNRPRDVWNRINLLLDQIRAFDETTHGTLRGFLRWVDSQIERQASLSERIVAEVDDEAVRLMTIHAAKGLEFPVVFAAGLGGGEYFEGGMRVAWDADGGLVFQAKVNKDHVSSKGAAQAFADERAQTDMERCRLLYVACTRAESRLIVSLFHPVRNSDECLEDGERFACMAKKLLNHLPKSNDLHAPWQPVGTAYLPNPDRWPRVEPETLDEWEAERAAIFASTRLLNISATAVAHRTEVEDVSLSERELIDSIHPRPRGRGTQFGLAVHSVLQVLDLANPVGLEALAYAHAERQHVEGKAVADAVRSALDTVQVQSAARSRHFKEAFASAMVQGVLLEGIIDLLVEDEEGLHVIDYKTDANASPLGRAKAMETYRLQAGSYALILEATSGRPVLDCTFLFLQGGPQAIEVLTGPDLEEAKTAVRNRLVRLPTL